MNLWASRPQSKRFLHQTLSVGDAYAPYFIHIGGNEGYKKFEIWEFKVRNSSLQSVFTQFSGGSIEWFQHLQLNFSNKRLEQLPIIIFMAIMTRTLLVISYDK